MSDNEPQPPVLAPGWYPDPQLPSQQRWWDGSQWTPGTRRAPMRLTLGNPVAALGCGGLLLLGSCMAYGACSKARDREAARGAEPPVVAPVRSASAGPAVSDPVRVEAKLDPAQGRVGHETAMRVMVHRFGDDPTGWQMQLHLPSEVVASRVVGGTGEQEMLGVYTAKCTAPIVVGADYWCSVMLVPKVPGAHRIAVGLKTPSGAGCLGDTSGRCIELEATLPASLL